MSAHARKAIQQLQRQRQIQAAIGKNEYTFVQMNTAEFFDFIINVKRLNGMSQFQISEWVEKILVKENINLDTINKYKESAKLYSAAIPVTMDAVALGALALEMRRSGNVFSKYQIKTYNGKPYIIFKGYAGLRKHLTGTKYLAHNPKVVSFGIGKLGVEKAIKGGFVVTIIISAFFHGIEQMINDNATWHDFIGGMAVDVSIAAVSSGIAWGLIATYVGGTAAMVAVGPMIAVVIIGTALTLLTSAFIDSDEMAKRISNSLRVMEENIKNSVTQLNYEIDRAERMYYNNPIEFIHRLFGIPYTGRRY